MSHVAPPRRPKPQRQSSARPTSPRPGRSPSPAGDFASDPNHSTVKFRLQHPGLWSYALKFGTYDATVTFDPAKIAASKVTATIRPGDILAGYPSDYVAKHKGVKSPSWEDDLANSTNFPDAKQIPAITFTPTSVEPRGEPVTKVTDDLTFNGETKPVTLDVTFARATASHPFSKTPAIRFSPARGFKRWDLGLDYLSGMIGDDASFEVGGDFIQTPPA